MQLIPEGSPNTLITPELRDSLDVWSTPVTSHLVERSDIRRWAIAVYWPEVPPRIFWDEEYAKTTRWNGIIAPREFNPFAWPAIRSTDRPALPAKGIVGQRRMNGGQKETYGCPIRPSDVIAASSALVQMEEKIGKLGLTLYKSVETRWSNQEGEFVRSRVSIYIIY